MENSYYGLKKNQDLITVRVKRECEEIQRKNMVWPFFFFSQLYRKCLKEKLPGNIRKVLGKN
jgi:hypothetical protein